MADVSAVASDLHDLHDLMTSNAHYGRFSGTVLVARGDPVSAFFPELGPFVERVSGTDLHGFLAEWLWRPRGLDNADSARVARPFIGLPTDPIEPEFWHDSWLLGAGCGYSDAYDLLYRSTIGLQARTSVSLSRGRNSRVHQ